MHRSIAHDMQPAYDPAQFPAPSGDPPEAAQAPADTITQEHDASRSKPHVVKKGPRQLPHLPKRRPLKADDLDQEDGWGTISQSSRRVVAISPRKHRVAVIDDETKQKKRDPKTGELVREMKIAKPKARQPDKSWKARTKRAAQHGHALAAVAAKTTIMDDGTIIGTVDADRLVRDLTKIRSLA